MKTVAPFKWCASHVNIKSLLLLSFVGESNSLWILHNSHELPEPYDCDGCQLHSSTPMFIVCVFSAISIFMSTFWNEFLMPIYVHEFITTLVYRLCSLLPRFGARLKPSWVQWQSILWLPSNNCTHMISCMFCAAQAPSLNENYEDVVAWRTKLHYY